MAPARNAGAILFVMLWRMSAEMNLMIKCPNTGRNADTGFSMTYEDFEVATLPGTAFLCGHCGEPHAWSKKDVVNAP